VQSFIEVSHGLLGIAHYDKGAGKKSSFYGTFSIAVMLRNCGADDFADCNEVLVISLPYFFNTM
jgi:hypothetical protein